MRLVLSLTVLICGAARTWAQEKSVKPGINDSFKDPKIDDFVKRFEIESREIYVHREAIVEACNLKAGQTVADIGAGTGLFTRLFSPKVGERGRVIAVDIAQKFLDHIQKSSREAGLRNVEVVRCPEDATGLAKESVDVAFVCDTYHHFEFPKKTLASLLAAMKPGGRVIIIDFKRIPGESSDWVMNHVRAGQEVVEAEMTKAGFKKLEQKKMPLRDNYFILFEKPATPAST